jgi:D-hydroxyproline dehydrogenase subunit gamma
MPERVAFFVDGKPVECVAGTTVAAALWNAGQRSFRRSLSGEARGALCAMGVCFECRVAIDDEPQRRACLEVVSPGMRIRTGERG